MRRANIFRALFLSFAWVGGVACGEGEVLDAARLEGEQAERASARRVDAPAPEPAGGEGEAPAPGPAEGAAPGSEGGEAPGSEGGEGAGPAAGGDISATVRASSLPAGVYGPDRACTGYNRDGFTCDFQGDAYFWDAWWTCSWGCLDWLGDEGGGGGGGGGRDFGLPEGVYGPDRACTDYNREGYTCNFSGDAYFWDAWWTCSWGCLDWLGDGGGYDGNGSGGGGSNLPAGVYEPDAACTGYNRDGFTCNFSGEAYFWSSWWTCSWGCLDWISY